MESYSSSPNRSEFQTEEDYNAKWGLLPQANPSLTALKPIRRIPAKTVFLKAETAVTGKYTMNHIRCKHTNCLLFIYN